MNAAEKKPLKYAKAGDEITAKAGATIRAKYSHLTCCFATREDCTVKPKSDAKRGQWCCIDCGEFFQNNMSSHQHQASHRRAWWTGTAIEEA